MLTQIIITMVDFVFATSDDLGFLEELGTQTAVILSKLYKTSFRAAILGKMKVFANI